MSEDRITVGQAATILGCSYPLADRFVRDGLLEVRARVGNYRLLDRVDVERLAEERRRTAASRHPGRRSKSEREMEG